VIAEPVAVLPVAADVAAAGVADGDDVPEELPLELQAVATPAANSTTASAEIRLAPLIRTTLSGIRQSMLFARLACRPAAG
jgi:hypothetical protein